MIKAWKSSPDSLYKFTSAYCQSWVGKCTWVSGKWLRAGCHGPVRLRTPTCLHAFNNPYVAVMLQPHCFPVVGSIMWRAQGAGERVTSDPTKSGYRLMRVLYPIVTPRIADLQRQLFYCHVVCARAKLIMKLAASNVSIFVTDSNRFVHSFEEDIKRLETEMNIVEEGLQRDVLSVDFVTDRNRNAFSTYTFRRYFSVIRGCHSTWAIKVDIATMLPKLCQVAYIENQQEKVKYLDVSALANNFFGVFQEERKTLAYSPL